MHTEKNVDFLFSTTFYKYIKKYIVNNRLQIIHQGLPLKNVNINSNHLIERSVVMLILDCVLNTFILSS